MDIIGIILILYLCYRNSELAKAKGQNGLLWGVATAVSYIVSEAFGLYLVIALFCRDTVDMSVLTKGNTNFDTASKQFNQQVSAALLANPLREITVFLFGLGGYLFVHYLINRKPNKKEPEIHWMDKMEQ